MRFLFCALLLAACSEKSQATINGDTNDYSVFALHDPDGLTYTIVLSQRASTCAEVFDGTAFALADALTLIVRYDAALTFPVELPVLSVEADGVTLPAERPMAQAILTRTNNTCVVVNTVHANGGKLTLRSQSGSKIDGTLAATTAADDHFSGDFTAKICTKPPPVTRSCVPLKR